jgi:ATP phosphoribosyltransferase
MYQFFIGIILVLGLGSYWLYDQNTTLKENNVKLESAIAEQTAAFDAMKESYEKQGQSLQNLSRANAQIEAEKDQYLAIFRKHNLDKLALMKPGLVQTRVNNATKAVFEELENDSKNISDLDSSNPD